MDHNLLELIASGNLELDFSTLVVLYMLDKNEEQARKPLFDLSASTDLFCLENFRFKKDHVFLLKDVLRIPDVIRTRHVVFNGVEGLCIMLRRLAYPNRLCDMKNIFNRKEPVLSMIISQMVNFIYESHRHLLQGMDHWWMDLQNKTEFAAAIHDQHAPLNNCIGFVDGTIRSICRLRRFQKEVYSGHKRTHGLKFQTVVVPNGLIANLFGPISGRRHDSYMLTESGLLEQLEASAPGFCVYGDPAYPHRPSLQAPYKGSRLTADQRLFNKRMSMNRVVVEWVFGKIISLFAFLDYKKNLKLYLQPVAKLYTVGALLTNCHTCLYGSQTTTKFDLRTPTLDEYVNGV